jgi:hypothetical protein
VADEDVALFRRWTTVVAATPSLLRPVLGGIQLKSQQVMADFLAADALEPTMLAAAAGGVIQAAHTRWALLGGDLPKEISDGLEVLERAIGTTPAR